MQKQSIIGLLILSAILVVPLNRAQAQEPPPPPPKQTITPNKRALIAELIEATESKRSALAVFDSMIEQQENQIPDVIWHGLMNTEGFQQLSSDEKVKLKEKTLEDSRRVSKRVKELFSEKIDFAQIVEDLFYEIYDKHFTEGELRDLLAFYRSPTGKKTVQLAPKMFAESMSGTVTRISPMMSEITTQLVNEETEKLRREFEVNIGRQPVKPKPRPRSRKRS